MVLREFWRISFERSGSVGVRSTDRIGSEQISGLKILKPVMLHMGRRVDRALLAIEEPMPLKQAAHNAGPAN